MIQTKVPLSGIREQDKWRYEEISEESVLGRQFAHAIVKVATGNGDELLKKKKEYPPCKKIFWEEPRFNAALENTNSNYAYDAHALEETKHWKKAGKKFVGGPRFAPPRNFNGPLAPEEFEHCFERPTVVFERSVELHPFERAKRYTKPRGKCAANPEKEYLEMRTSLIGPSTYQLPDLWDSTVSHGIDTSSALQPVFRSTTPRFKDRKSLRSEFPEEKVGASIPHSRGRSRGGGFKELPRPMTEGEIAARLASHSISTWESFRDAPLPTFDSSASSNVLSGNPDMFNNADPDKFFELSTISRPLTGAPQREKSANNNVRSKPNSRPSLSQSTGSLLQSAPNSRGFSQRSRGSGGVLPGSRSKDSASGNGDNGGMILYNQKQRRSKSRMPGFTILSKSVTPIFDVPDYHKSYQRATLPDGTVAIIPVTSQSSTPLNMSKKTSFNRDSLTKDSKYDSIAAEESLQSAMHLLGNNGPQLRSITPPHPSPPSLTRGSNLFSTLRGNSLPKEAASPSGSQQGRLLTSDGNILDDELSINSATTRAAKGSSNGGSATTSYSQAVMQTWVPPVSYSSKSKVPVPDVGAIPYPASSSSRRQAGHGARRGGGNSSSTIDGNFANSLIEEFLPLPFQHQLQQRPGSKGPSSKLSLSPVNGRPGSSEDLRKMSKVTSAGGLKAGERKRQDSIGAVPLPVGEFALRHVATKESAQVLKSLGE